MKKLIGLYVTVAIVAAMVFGATIPPTANPTLTNFDARHFSIDPARGNTHLIQTRLSDFNFDKSGDTWLITNVTGATGASGGDSLWTNINGRYTRLIDTNYPVNIGSNAVAGFLATITNGAFVGGQFAQSTNTITAKGGSIAGGGFKQSQGNVMTADGGSHAGGSFAPSGNSNIISAKQGSFAGIAAWNSAGNVVQSEAGSIAIGRLIGATESVLTASGGGLSMGDLSSGINNQILSGSGGIAITSLQSAFTNDTVTAYGGSIAAGFPEGSNERVWAGSGGSLAMGSDVVSPNAYSWTLGRHYTNEFSEGFAIGYDGLTAFHVDPASGWTGAGTLFFADDGTFKAAGGGGGLTINPTDGYLPYRINATTFGDSVWFQIATNKAGFGLDTNVFISNYPNGGNSGLAIGRGALASVVNHTSADGRTLAIGENAGNVAFLAGGSVLLGWAAGAYATNLINSTVIGSAGGVEDADGLVSIGNSAGPGFAHSRADTIIGTSAAFSINGSTNTVIGYSSAYANSGYAPSGVPSTTSLTAVGAWSSYVNQGGTGNRSRSYNTAIGTWAGWSPLQDVDITNTIAIGFNVPITNSNEIVIGNVDNTKVIFPIPSFTGAGTKYLDDSGIYSTPGGGGGTAINPTDGFLPQRSNATTFIDSPIHGDSATGITIGGNGAMDVPSNTEWDETLSGFSANWRFVSGGNSILQLVNPGAQATAFSALPGSLQIDPDWFSINDGTEGHGTMQYSVGGIMDFTVSSPKNYTTNALGARFLLSRENVTNTFGTSPYLGWQVKNGTNWASRFDSYVVGQSNAVSYWVLQGTSAVGAPTPLLKVADTGGLTISGTTNFITFGATNAAPVTPGTVAKWVSVSIDGEATEYRLPLYK